MVRIEDIANKLGVTKSTVSKALNGAPDIGEPMRKKVFETAIAMGYKKVIKKVDSKIAVLIRNMSYKNTTDFGYNLVLGFRQMAESNNIKVHIVDATEELMKSMDYDVFMLQNDYIGSFVIGFSLVDRWTKQFKTCKTPTVLYDNSSKGNTKVSYVGADSREGMENAIAHLCDLGHTKIAYLGGLLGSHYSKERYEGFKFALRQHKLKFDKELYGDAYLVSDCVSKHLSKVIEKGATAVVCGHDLLAHEVIAGCKKMGKRVPEDISVIGFDDLLISKDTEPPLTTIKQDCLQIGRSGYYAFKSLLDDVPIGTILLHTQLVIRNSTEQVNLGEKND